MLAAASPKLEPSPVSWRDLGQPYSLYFKRIIPVAEVLVALASLAAVLTAFNLHRVPSVAGFLSMRVTVKNLVLLLFFTLFWSGSAAGARLVFGGEAENFTQDLRRVAVLASLGSIPTLAFPLTSVSRAFGWTEFFAFWVIVNCGLIVAHGAIRLAGNLFGPRLVPVSQCIVVGSGPRASTLMRLLRSDSERRYEVVGIVDRAGAHTEPEVFRQGDLLGEVNQLAEILKTRAVDEVLVALPVKSCYTEIQSVVDACEKVGVSCRIPSDLFSYSIGRPRAAGTGSRPEISLHMVRNDGTVAIKRVIDVIGAGLGLILLAPVLLAAALAVRLGGPGPVIFRQERYGHNRRLFTMYKFRSMRSDAEQRQKELEQFNEMGGPVFKIANDPRVTRVGRWLRRTSIDELPQLWNVLTGSMSLVGPRPLPARDVSQFSEAWLMRRFSVKPGITGLWQVSGRNSVSFERWIALDLAYIDNWSLWLDVKILARTVAAVIRGTGAV